MKDRCPCGGIILADTEDWQTPLCDECYCDMGEPRKDPWRYQNKLRSLIEHVMVDRNKVSVHGSDGCMNCDTGRITIYAGSRWCLECQIKKSPTPTVPGEES